MKNSELHELRYFFSAYFHEDWIVEFPDDRSAIFEYCTSASGQKIDQCKNDIDNLLEKYSSDQQLRVSVSALGCYVDLTGLGLGMREWLLRVRSLLCIHSCARSRRTEEGKP